MQFISWLLIVISILSFSPKSESSLSLLSDEGWESTGETLDRIDLIGSRTIRINGEIKKGDLEKIINLIEESDGNVTKIQITSQGGDALEAMRIGRFVKRRLLYIRPSDHCYSACALIFIASPVLGEFSPSNPDRMIGLHRPRFNQAYFSDLNSTEAQEKHSELSRKVAEYAVEMGMPQWMVDRMMATPSQDLIFMSQAEYYSQAGRPAAIDEWLHSRCEMLTSEEEDDLYAALAYHYYVTENWGSRQNPLIDEGASFSEGYREYLIKKHRRFRSCVRSSIEEERKRLFKELLAE